MGVQRWQVGDQKPRWRSGEAMSGHVAAIGGGHPGTRGAPRSHVPPAVAHD